MPKPNDPWDPYDLPPGQAKKHIVPEPATTGALVLAGAALLLAWWRWKRTRK